MMWYPINYLRIQIYKISLVIAIVDIKLGWDKINGDLVIILYLALFTKIIIQTL